MSLAHPERILERFPGYALPPGTRPRYNVAPTDPVLVARAGENQLTEMRWGLVPAWARDLAFGRRTFNARLETLAEKPAFRGALRARRCLIFADGFYEWTGPAKHKVPFRFTVDGGAPFAFAALWERWGSRDAAVDTATVVTCSPNTLLARMHDRMPAILDDGAIRVWLEGTLDEALAVIAPFDAERMHGEEVSRAVNRAGFDDPSCIAPV